MVALAEYESSLDEYGFPLEEVLSKDFDRDNSKGKGFFEAEAPLSHTRLAVERARKALGDDGAWDQRLVRVKRVER